MRNDPLRIVMFAAEASPYAKVGGLADVTASLPKALEELGVQSTLVIPAYRSALSGGFDISPCSEVPGFDILMGSTIERAEIFRSRLNQTDIEVYLIGSGKYFDRDGIYDDPATQEGYHDNMERYIFFMKSGLELLMRLEKSADVLHCHDSHSALIPGLIHTNHSEISLLASAKTLFTIHNLAYQGIYAPESLYYAGIDRGHFYPMSPFEYSNKVNFTKAGIVFADKVNTVSQTYADEILTSSEIGMGLEGVLKSRKNDVSGIINGIDYDEWNPEKDSHIAANFSVQDLTGKKKCKEALLQHFRLPRFQGRVPLIGIVSRLADQKGFDLIAKAIGEITSLKLQLVVLGTGQKQYHEILRQLASRYPERIAVRLAFDDELAHKIEAGCDMFLMPSRYEPCGLNQLYSLRYGTIPIVRSTGGLADTVVDNKRDNGTGFSFSGYSSGQMITAIERALKTYEDGARWQSLMIRAMSEDWSWNRSARKYMELYRSMCRRARSKRET